MFLMDFQAILILIDASHTLRVYKIRKLSSREFNTEAVKQFGD